MKTIKRRFIPAVLALVLTAPLTAEGNDTIRIACPASLSSLVTDLADGYSKVKPSVFFTIATLSHGAFGGDVSVLITDNAALVQPAAGSESRTVIGHCPVVALYNSDNPLAETIMKAGISESMLKKVLSVKTGWQELFGNEEGSPVKVLISDLAFSGPALRNFEENLMECTTVPADKLLDEVKSDPNAIGFITLNELSSPLPASVSFLPVDKNGNRKIDSFEAIYSDFSTLSRGIWLGKYPRKLSVDITAIPLNNNTDEAGAFIAWVASQGAPYLSDNGYTALSGAEINAATASLNSGKTEVASSPAILPYLIWFVIVLAVAALAFAMYLLSGKQGKAVIPAPKPEGANGGLSLSTLTAPAGLFYDRTHTWAFMERDGLVRVGIDDFIQRITGDVTRLIMKEPGTHIRRGEVLVTIVQDGKQLNLYSPVSGKVKSQNTDLAIDSTIVNGSPYTDGWMYLIEPANWIRENRFMFMSDKFMGWIDGEFGRLKDFFARAGKKNELALAHIVLQDGGELTENVLSQFGPEIWEEFQQHFIDTSK
jgi:glycine cleavage system H lipoate-binding protein